MAIMKRMTLCMSVLLVLSFAGLAQAKGKGKKPPTNTVKGEIIKIDGNQVTVRVGKNKDANMREVVFTTDANTQVIREGNQGQVSDLKVGQRVTVSPSEGTASRIEIRKEQD